MEVLALLLLLRFWLCLVENEGDLYPRTRQLVRNKPKVWPSNSGPVGTERELQTTPCPGRRRRRRRETDQAFHPEAEREGIP